MEREEQRRCGTRDLKRIARALNATAEAQGVNAAPMVQSCGGVRLAFPVVVVADGDVRPLEWLDWTPGTVTPPGTHTYTARYEESTTVITVNVDDGLGSATSTRIAGTDVSVRSGSVPTQPASELMTADRDADKAIQTAVRALVDLLPTDRYHDTVKADLQLAYEIAQSAIASPPRTPAVVGTLFSKFIQRRRQAHLETVHGYSNREVTVESRLAKLETADPRGFAAALAARDVAWFHREVNLLTNRMLAATQNPGWSAAEIELAAVEMPTQHHPRSIQRVLLERTTSLRDSTAMSWGIAMPDPVAELDLPGVEMTDPGRFARCENAHQLLSAGRKDRHRALMVAWGYMLPPEVRKEMRQSLQSQDEIWKHIGARFAADGALPPVSWTFAARCFEWRRRVVSQAVERLRTDDPGRVSEWLHWRIVAHDLNSDEAPDATADQSTVEVPLTISQPDGPRYRLRDRAPVVTEADAAEAISSL